MAPAQGPTNIGSEMEKRTFQSSNSSKKKMSGNRRRKPITLDPMSLTFMTSICKEVPNDEMGLNSNVNAEFLSAIIESIQPAVFFALDARTIAKGSDIQSFRVPGYQLHSQETFLPSEDICRKTLVYTHSQMKSIPIRDLESTENEAVWLKLTHPDPIYDENVDDDSNGIRIRTANHPITIVGSVIHHHNSQRIVNFLEYVSASLKKGLELYPSANIVFFGECYMRKPDNFEKWMKYYMIRNNLNKEDFILDCFKLEENQEIDANDFHHLYFTIRNFFYKDANVMHDVLPGSVNQKFLSVTAKRNNCPFCQEAFTTSNDLYEHRKSMRHRKNHCAALYYNNRKSLIKSKHGLAISAAEPTSPEIIKNDVEEGKICLNIKPGVKTTLTLKIDNSNPIENQNVDDAGQKLGLVIKSIEFLRYDPNFELTDRYGFTKSFQERPNNVRNGIRLSNGSSFEVEIKISKKHIGNYRIPLIAQYRIDPLEDNKTVHHLARELFVKVTNADVESVQPIAPYEPPKKVVNKKFGVRQSVIPGKPPSLDESSKTVIEALPQKVGLDQYKLDPILEKILNHGLRIQAAASNTTKEILSNCRRLLESPLSENMYKERFMLLLQSEEHQMNIDIRGYDMEDVIMTQVKNRNHLLQLDIPGLAEKRPSVLRGDKIFVRIAADETLDIENPGNCMNAKEYEGFVHEVEETSVLLGFSEKLINRFLPNMKFNVRFTISRFPLRNMYRAIEKVEPGFLFPKLEKDAESKTEEAMIKSYFNRDIENNFEQKTAVNQILSGGIKGAPYIIFGPPGTGKTVTIVEAIKQIWHCKPGSNILATAPSNAAADLLAQRLVKHVPKSEILRYYAPTRSEKEIPDDIHCISNLKIDCSNQTTILKCRVVVVTLITAGRLLSAGIPDRHFSHVFIDEAGHAMEPEACVAISGILDHNHGQLILAGDPKQLGPVLRSPIALKFGLQTSLLERLMLSTEDSSETENSIYQRNAETGKYNHKAITKLLSNFRSHPSLLNLPSKLFYDGELLPKGDPIITTSLEGWEKLPNSKFPMIFHGVIGEDKREARSPSFFNAEEAVTVVDYIQDLLTAKKGISKKVLPKEIGVISPYRRQVEKIKWLMNRRFQGSGGKTTGGSAKFIEGIPDNWKEVSVGSTEEFQGQERRIIIMTTVRSQPDLLQHDFRHKLGFLRNPKRFNVAITRAKALLIVVGNPNLLSLDSHWREFIRYTIENGGYKGVNFNLPPEVSSGVDHGHSRDCIDQMQDLELLDLERRFRDMGFLIEESESSESEDSDLLDSFEKVNIEDVTQESQEWRTEY